MISRTWRTGSAIATTLVLMLGLAILPAAAQDAASQATFDFFVYAVACESDPGPVATADGFPPPDCVPVGDVVATIADAGGSQLAVCTTGAGGSCVAEVPFDIAVVVTADDATIPAGYELRENPIKTRSYGESVDAVFVGLATTADEPSGAPVGRAPGDATAGDRDDTAVDDDASALALPNTGTGAADGSVTSVRTVGLTLAVLTLAPLATLIGMAWLVRRGSAFRVR
jgi:hypothetical protein